MQLSAEVLDHIFSFLVSSHRETLVACSKDPVLSPIVERHLYHYVIVHIAKGAPDSKHCTFEPDRLSKLVSEKPRILNHVRKLQIVLEGVRPPWQAHFGPMQLDKLDHFCGDPRYVPQLSSSPPNSSRVIGSGPIFF